MTTPSIAIYRTSSLTFTSTNDALGLPIPPLSSDRSVTRRLGQLLTALLVLFIDENEPWSTTSDERFTHPANAVSPMAVMRSRRLIARLGPASALEHQVRLRHGSRSDWWRSVALPLVVDSALIGSFRLRRDSVPVVLLGPLTWVLFGTFTVESAFEDITKALPSRLYEKPASPITSSAADSG